MFIYFDSELFDGFLLILVFIRMFRYKLKFSLPFQVIPHELPWLIDYYIQRI